MVRCEQAEARHPRSTLTILAGIASFEDNIRLQGPRTVPCSRRRAEGAQSTLRRNRLIVTGVGLRDVDKGRVGPDRERVPSLTGIMDSVRSIAIGVGHPRIWVIDIPRRDNKQSRSLPLV